VLVVMAYGLAILATESIWARRALRRCKGVVVGVKRTPLVSALPALAQGGFIP